MEIGNIVQIPKASINKICCGQVVVTLAVAVKELIENSLDADATKIDIKFKEHGSELIEVIDNGTGILQGDFENITKMHTTSKLSQFEDLNSISTFGFRGEALGSLCQLGKLSIHTYNPHDSSGTYLVFDSTGQVVSREERARQAGTTVSVCQLFSKLRVRRVELLRNIKREFNRALQILTGYCLACSNAKITCYKIDSKGNKSVILSNDYGATLSQNISTIFGPQQVSSLKTIPEIDSIPNEILEEFRLDGESLDLSIVQIEGLVSSCLPGQGRSSCDRQYLYVNGRPCDIPRLASLINSLYRQYNRTQYPTFVIKIQLPIDSVDVNLAPDKRQIFLTHEKLVSAYVKSCLSFLFDGQNVTGCDFQQMSLIQSPRQVVRSTSPIKSIISQFSPCAAYSPDAAKSSTNLSNLKRFSSPISDSNKNICQPRESQIKRRRTQHLSQFKVTNIKDYLTENEEKHLDNDESIFSKSTPSGDNTEPAAEILHQLNGVDDIAKLDTTVQAEYEKTVYCDPMKCEVIDLSSMIHETGDSQSGESESWRMSQSSSESRADSDRNEEKCVQTFNIVGDCEEVCYQTLSDETVADKSSHFSFYHQNTADNNSTPTPPVSNLLIHKSVRSVELKFDLSIVKTKLDAYNMRSRRSSGFDPNKFNHLFKAKINPEDNEKAEEELRTIFEKESFKKLSVIGQFNRGFILAALDRNIFIIDQHASDEKYNFERLQKGLQMKMQKLVIPKPLRFTVTQEEVVIENMEVFKNNGFDIFLDENAQLGNRLKLISIPTNRNYTFGKDDIEEMIFVLSENGSGECKPSRIRHMLATQACRMSIMIGTALTKTEMKKILCHMSELDQPWNCPHGRPTIRHIINLCMLTSITNSP